MQKFKLYLISKHNETNHISAYTVYNWKCANPSLEEDAKSLDDSVHSSPW